MVRPVTSIIKKLQGKVRNARKIIEVKNKEKVERYRDKMKKQKEGKEMSSLPAEYQDFSNLRVFSVKTITPSQSRNLSFPALR